MKTLIQFPLQATGRSWIVLACVIALNAGCRTAPPNGSAASAQVQTLDTSLSALKAAFNRDTSKPRLLALFSPSCGGCIYGATALQHEARKIPGLAEHMEVLIVWVSMLETDNEAEARQAAKRFDFPGVRDFYDDKNHVGGALMAEQFPNAIREALGILPADSPLREKLESKKDLPPEKIPLWDSVLVFPPGVRWEERSPKPAWWTRQTGSTVQDKAGGSKVVFWKSGRPVGSDWYPEAREALEVAGKLNEKGP